jgi:hypothetical protein
MWIAIRGDFARAPYPGLNGLEKRIPTQRTQVLPFSIFFSRDFREFPSRWHLIYLKSKYLSRFRLNREAHAYGQASGVDA